MEKNREPRNKPTPKGQLIFDKGGKSIQWGKDTVFRKWCWEKWTGTCKKMKLDHQLTPHRRINTKWRTDLNVSHETIKILEENIGSKIQISCVALFLPTSPGPSETKEKVNNWDPIKLKSSAQLLILILETVLKAPFSSKRIKELKGEILLQDCNLKKSTVS